ncbi:MAG: hypothetical protein U9R34_06110 [Nanoarchaeota archaeon]|nr:hypothetical protein [Nanoarchaeota archaeon]
MEPKLLNIVKLSSLISIILILLINISLGVEDGGGPPPDDTTTSSQEDYKTTIQNNPTSATKQDMAQYPETTKQYWDKFSDSQKDDLYEDHMDKFEDKFAEYWIEKRGLYINPRNGQYNKYHKSITYPDGTEILLDTMQNNHIEPKDNGVLIDGNKYTNAKNLQGNPDSSISVQSADLIQSDNVDFINLSNSNIKTDDSYATIITNESIRITTDSVVYVDPINTAIITVSKTPEINSYYTSDERGFIKVDEQYTRFNITSAILTYKDETATANSTISLLVNKDKGFGCMDISPIGSYYKSYPDDYRKNFLIYVYLDEFNLCFRKTRFDKFGELQNKSGLVDHITNEIKLNGKAKYKRFPFSESGITEAYTKNVLDCIDDCSALIQLDTNNLYIKELSVNSKQAIVNPTQYITIHEYPSASYFNLTNYKSNNIILRYTNLFSGFTATIENNIYKHKNLHIHPYNKETLLAFTTEYNQLIEELS